MKSLLGLNWVCRSACLLLFSILTACGQAETVNVAARPVPIQEGVSDLVEAVCDRQVVILGEGGHHGQGTTQTFKGDVIAALVENCGFELVLFEASFYEFARLDAVRNAGGEITQDEEHRARISLGV